jgi:hypothetical protein
VDGILKKYIIVEADNELGSLERVLRIFALDRTGDYSIAPWGICGKDKIVRVLQISLISRAVGL